MNLVIRICLLFYWYMVVAVRLVEVSSSSWILSKEYSYYSTHFEWPRQRYQLDYVSTEDSALEILDYIKANCGEIVCNRWCSLVVKLPWAFVFRLSEIAEKAIIDGSLCIPSTKRLAKISIFLVSLFGKLMFNKLLLQTSVNAMNKLYPKLAFPEEIKALFGGFARTPVKTLVTIYKNLMRYLQAERYNIC